MNLVSSSKKAAGILSAMALCLSSTGAIAAATPHQSSLSPFVALSALGSDVSVAALCGASTVAGASAVTQGAAQGCVLPAVDQAPPVMVETAPPPPVMMEPGAAYGGAGVSPLLLALVGIAAAVGIYYLAFRSNSNFHIVFPPFPQSPS